MAAGLVLALAAAVPLPAASATAHAAPATGEVKPAQAFDRLLQEHPRARPVSAIAPSKPQPATETAATVAKPQGPEPALTAALPIQSLEATAELLVSTPKPAAPAGAVKRVDSKPGPAAAPLVQLLGGSVAGDEPSVDSPLPSAPKSRAEEHEPAVPALLTAAPPEQFLQWLDAVKDFQDQRPEQARAKPPGPMPALIKDAGGLPAPIPAAPGNATADSLSAATPLLTATAPPLGSPPTAPSNLFVLMPPATAVAATAAQPVPASLPPVMMDTPDWPQRLGEQIHWRLGEGVQEARIEISPRELGTVDVHLSMNDSGLRVHLSAAQAQTRELLQNELPRLREILQQAGVQLADAQVGREAPGRDTARNRTQGQGAGKTRDEDDSFAVKPAWRRSNGLLDDYA